jgi:hypothetical protein
MQKTPIPLYRQGNATSFIKMHLKALMEMVLELPIDRRLALVNAITQSIGQELLNRAA